LTTDKELKRLREERKKEILGETPVNEEHFIGAMKYLKELKAYAVQNDLDSWAVRQALVLTLEFDTIAALNNPKVTQEQLYLFDAIVIKNARDLYKQFEAMDKGVEGL